jgi:hypothetical protein
VSPLSDDKISGLKNALYCVKDRAKTFGEVIDKASFILGSMHLGDRGKGSQIIG